MSGQPTQQRWWKEADTDPVHLEAMEWFARLEDPQVSLEDSLAWQAWMEADPRHAQAFDRIDEISNAMRFVRSPPRQGSWALARDAYDAAAPLSQWHSPARPNLALAASVVAGAVALTWAMWTVDSGHQMLTSAVGENRTIALEDGSKVVLGGDTRVKVTFDGNARSLELEQGEALFTVAHDATRPFRVHAGNTSVLAVGTAFNVRRGRDCVVVAVTEGRVIVEPESDLAPVHLGAGEQTTVRKTGIEPATPLSDITAATAWQSGRLAFRLQPLGYVLEDVNRYARKPVVLEDSSIGELVITGTVDAANIAEWIGSLEQGFGLKAVEKTDQILLRKQ